MKECNTCYKPVDKNLFKRGAPYCNKCRGDKERYKCSRLGEHYIRNILVRGG